MTVQATVKGGLTNAQKFIGISKLSGAVCSIEVLSPKTGYWESAGSGFLIERGVVLTQEHVFSGKDVFKRGARARFLNSGFNNSESSFTVGFVPEKYLFLSEIYGRESRHIHRKFGVVAVGLTPDPRLMTVEKTALSIFSGCKPTPGSLIYVIQFSDKSGTQSALKLVPGTIVDPIQSKGLHPIMNHLEFHYEVKVPGNFTGSPVVDDEGALLGICSGECNLKISCKLAVRIDAIAATFKRNSSRLKQFSKLFEAKTEEIIREHDPGRREFAIDLQQIKKGLEDTKIGVRSYNAGALGELAKRVAGKDLTTALELCKRALMDSSSIVRIDAANALVELAKRVAGKDLTTALELCGMVLNDTGIPAPFKAAEALVKLAERAKGNDLTTVLRLCGRALDINPLLRDEAAMVLRGLAGRAAGKDLTKALELCRRVLLDTDYPVRINPAEALVVLARSATGKDLTTALELCGRAQLYTVPSVRGSAAEALVVLARRATGKDLTTALELCERALKDICPIARIKAVRVLEELAKEATGEDWAVVLELFKKALGDSDSNVLRRAAEALVVLARRATGKDSGIVRDLCKRVIYSGYTDGFGGATRALEELVKRNTEMDFPTLLQWCKKGLIDNDDHVRLGAARALKELAREAVGKELAIVLGLYEIALVDGDVNVRSEAAKALKWLDMGGLRGGNLSFLHDLCKRALLDNVTDVNREASRALKRLAKEAIGKGLIVVVRLINRGLKNDDHYVRWGAARALMALANRPTAKGLGSVVEVCKKALGNPFVDARRGAAKSLVELAKRVTGKGLDVLLESLKIGLVDQDPFVRKEVLWALRQIVDRFAKEYREVLISNINQVAMKEKISESHIKSLIKVMDSIQQKEGGDVLDRSVLQINYLFAQPSNPHVHLDIIDTTTQAKLEVGRFFDTAISDGNVHRLLLEGTIGSGKTALCFQLAGMWADERLWNEQFDKIYLLDVEKLNQKHHWLGSWKPENMRYQWLSDAICSQFGKGPTLDVLLNKGNKILIIFDGFDRARVNLKKEIENFFRDEKVNILLTARSGEMDIFKKDCTRSLKMDVLEPKQCEAYLKAYFPEKELHSIIEEITMDQNLATIYQNPLQLSLLVKSIKRNGIVPKEMNFRLLPEFLISSKGIKTAGEVIIGEIALRCVEMGTNLIPLKELKKERNTIKGLDELVASGILFFKRGNKGKAVYFYNETYRDYFASKMVASKTDSSIVAFTEANADKGYQFRRLFGMLVYELLSKNRSDIAKKVFDILFEKQIKNRPYGPLTALQGCLYCLSQANNSELEEFIWERYSIQENLNEKFTKARKYIHWYSKFFSLSRKAKELAKGKIEGLFIKGEKLMLKSAQFVLLPLIENLKGKELAGLLKLIESKLQDVDSQIKEAAKGCLTKLAAFAEERPLVHFLPLLREGSLGESIEMKKVEFALLKGLKASQEGEELLNRVKSLAEDKRLEVAVVEQLGDLINPKCMEWNQQIIQILDGIVANGSAVVGASISLRKAAPQLCVYNMPLFKKLWEKIIKYDNPDVKKEASLAWIEFGQLLKSQVQRKVFLDGLKQLFEVDSLVVWEVLIKNHKVFVELKERSLLEEIIGKCFKIKEKPDWKILGVGILYDYLQELPPLSESVNEFIITALSYENTREKALDVFELLKLKGQMVVFKEFANKYPNSPILSKLYNNFCENGLEVGFNKLGNDKQEMYLTDGQEKALCLLNPKTANILQEIFSQYG